MTPFERADYAKTLLASEAFKAAYEDVRKTLLEELEVAGITDTATQQGLVLSLQCLKGIKNRLERYVQDGLIEEQKSKAQEALEARRESLEKTRFGGFLRSASSRK